MVKLLTWCGGCLRAWWGWCGGYPLLLGGVWPIAVLEMLDWGDDGDPPDVVEVPMGVRVLPEVGG